MQQTSTKNVARALVALAAVSIIGALGCGATDDTEEMQAALDDLAVSEVDGMHLLGMGITVAMPDGRVFRSAAGSSDPMSGAPYDLAETRQVVGSVTKVYTAVMIMQLVEEGLLSLDDTVDRWLSFPRANEITVRMLLRHTSGLREMHDVVGEENLGRVWAPEELLQVTADAGLWAPPGDGLARYSNTNYVALGLVLEAVTGETWEESLTARIIEPLGLSHTFDAADDTAPGHVAGGWVQTEDGWVDSTTFIDPSIGWANGSLTTTNDDLVTFARAFFAGELFASRETLDVMLSFDLPMDPEENGGQPTTIGLCIQRVEAQGLVLIGHLGHLPGYGAAMLLEPESGAVIVITANTNGVLPGFTAVKIAGYLQAR